MGKVIKLNVENKRSSLLSTIIRGTPFEFSFFGKHVQVMGARYLMRKKKEFFNNYWDRFSDGLSRFEETGFNSMEIIKKFNSLSDNNRSNVFWQCSEIYAFENKLTYSKFIDVVNSYSLRVD